MRQDFKTALDQLEQWIKNQLVVLSDLDQSTGNIQLLRDTSQRLEWMAEIVEHRSEIDAHAQIVKSVQKMGEKILEEKRDKIVQTPLVDQLTNENTSTDDLRRRLEKLQSHWQKLLFLSDSVKYNI